MLSILLLGGGGLYWWGLIVDQRIAFRFRERAKQARRMTASPMKPVKRSKEAS